MSAQLNLYVLVQAVNPVVIAPFHESFVSMNGTNAPHNMSAEPGSGLLRLEGRDVGYGVISIWEEIEGALMRSQADTVIRVSWDDASDTWRIRAKRGINYYLADFDRSTSRYRQLVDTDDPLALVDRLLTEGQLPRDEGIFHFEAEHLHRDALDLAFQGFKPGRFLPFLLLAYDGLVERFRFFDSVEAVDTWIIDDTTRRLIKQEGPYLKAYALVYDATMDSDDGRHDALMVIHDVKGRGKRQLYYRRYEGNSGAVLDEAPQPHRETVSLFSE